MSFDYSKTLWGAKKVSLNPCCLQALRLHWCLQDLTEVKGRVLDLGCGRGGMAKAIKHYRSDLEVIGCDISSKAIEDARKDSQGVKFINAKATKLPFKTGSLGAVVCFDVLEHLENLGVVLGEINRVLKPNGVFHSFLPLENQPGSLYWLLFRLGWKGKVLAGHIQTFDRKKILSLLRKTGFKPVKKRYAYHWLFQVIDLLHYAAWTLLKKRPVKNVWFFRLLPVVAPFINLESWLLAAVPGGGLSLGSVKERQT
jgi:ubiquinone/menaquinone biosynthesis C-methylase UbiE